jgi:hypothetical protein
MEEIFLGLTVVMVSYYYFNMRGKNRCIMMNPKCSGLKCIKKQ